MPTKVTEFKAEGGGTMESKYRAGYRGVKLFDIVYERDTNIPQEVIDKISEDDLNSMCAQPSPMLYHESDIPSYP